jgi:acetyltransferase-like isoleucine patch superfamily enzyme
LVSALLAWFQLRACASLGASPRVLGHVWAHGPGRIRLGDRVLLDARQAPIELHAARPGAEIVIGDDVVIGGGTSIEAEQSIRIGDRTKIGTFCRVMDTHAHPTTGDRTRRPRPSPVVVDADVEMGARAILLAGAYVEHDVVICASTVVTRRIRARTIVRGVPCHVMRDPRDGPDGRRSAR